ncbi:pickpocket protein 11-like isoform X4 [Nilaparvata lugens]|uniref:pickpocket protein 11-like isoform X4 n=1 Tax=Nilaparvata lugens TaxID=108931 RepID=UPI00193D2CBC|nr:pickpocket protein 11-like isoform X4 [Nilaparvata lugens]
MKLYTVILEKRLRRVVEQDMEEEQAAFRPDESLDDYGSSHCNCLPACTELSYEVDSFTTPRNFQYFNLTSRMMPGNIVNVEAFFETKSVTNLQRVGIVTDADFIANIGGLMGLFLGFSFISVFEAIYLYIIRWITNRWRASL